MNIADGPGKKKTQIGKREEKGGKGKEGKKGKASAH